MSIRFFAWFIDMPEQAKISIIKKYIVVELNCSRRPGTGWYKEIFLRIWGVRVHVMMWCSTWRGSVCSCTCLASLKRRNSCSLNAWCNWNGINCLIWISYEKLKFYKHTTRSVNNIFSKLASCFSLATGWCWSSIRETIVEFNRDDESEQSTLLILWSVEFRDEYESAELSAELMVVELRMSDIVQIYKESFVRFFNCTQQNCRKLPFTSI